MAGIFKAYDIRGIYPEQLNEQIAEKIGRAFTIFLKAKKIVVGRDVRPHSKPIFEALAKGITEQGADVIDLGLCSTPMSYFANGKLSADGSIIITASHNPAEWNGFKLSRKEAIPISGATGIADIEKLVENSKWPVSTQKGTVIKYDISKEYGEFLRKHAKLNRKLRVVVDFANAMGSFEIAGIRDMFEIIPLYEELDGSFPNHEANPLKTETLENLRKKVVETGADFGAGFDGDADRCGFVDNKGNIIPMDLFTALIAQDILSNGPATILYDLRSSWAVKECIEANGGKAIMSRVGHAFIKAQMREYGAVFAGELSGHYYFKENFTAESQGLAFLMFANLICKTGKSASELVAPLKKYYSSGEINSKVLDVKQILNKIKTTYKDGNLFELDGVSVEYDNWWFNVRASNTEPLLRLIVEAKTKELMEEKKNELLRIIKG
ncbi:MAG TPA: phosphomannomutase/phosphoglucomutase [Victivallales bacterium]|nr:phosphomannomutase/phosphoglucomutase [Victivallales bacterium]HPO90671.1 phosphomannomutase/phosphoglucomutase [Victivallales bacterium]HRR06740.1 phosphomannomutase/phosphoglucomutase [Victivallales bacterium]HRR28728.1 phosphomannomutase/phosphoglucomutase [Victivallales bacterium]